MNETEEQKLFLKKLNGYLEQMERGFLEKCRTQKRIYEPRLTKNGGDLVEWEIGFAIGYSVKDKRSSEFSVCYLDYILKNDEFFVWRSQDAMQNIEVNIDASWCDLMKGVYQRAERWHSIFDISSITTSIKIVEKQSLIALFDKSV